VYELDITVPKERNMSAYAQGEKLDIKYEGGNLAGLLKEKGQNVAEKNERQLCLDMGERCVSGKIRSIRVIGDQYDGGTFMAEVEVGTLKNWAKNQSKALSRREADPEGGLG